MRRTCVIFLSLFVVGLAAQPNAVVDSLKQAVRTAKTDSLRADAMNELAWALYRSNLDTAITICLESCRIAEAGGIDEETAEAHNNLGVFYSEKGQYAEAMKEHQKAFGLREQIGNKKAIAISVGNIGSVYEDQGDNAKALEYYLKALDIDVSINNQAGVARHNNNIGLLYRRIGEYDKALEHARKALAAYQLVGDKSGEAKSYNNLGSAYRYMGDYTNALFYATKAAEINLANGNQMSLAINYGNIGTIYCSIADTITNGSKDSLYALGLKYYMDALDITERLGQKKGSATHKGNIGVLHMRLGNYTSAEQFLLDAAAIGRELKDTAGLATRFESLAELYARMYNWQKAYEYQLLYTICAERLTDEEKSKAIGKAEARADFEKEQAVIQTTHQKELEKAQAIADAEQEQQQIVLMAVGLIALIIAGVAIYIFYSLRTTRRQKVVIEEQKELVEEKNKEITDSISYARRLQEAILPPKKFWKSLLAESFVLYEPKDIVAGDFYFLEKSDDHIIFGAADCTGHGVPGAMVSVVCSNALTRAVREFRLTDPGKILDKVRELVLETFEKSESVVNDGMDISLCAYDVKSQQLHWAGANRPLWCFDGNRNEIEELSGTKQPIGATDHPQSFSTHSRSLHAHNVIYLFTDGFADQFGGPKGKKLKTANLKKRLLEIGHKDLAQQEHLLREMFDTWRGDYEQVDDVCVIGVRLHRPSAQ
jgi:serine phosphatase RsbU (regulator of sigma subunit)/Tfp pilus assembly protein PilF